MFLRKSSFAESPSLNGLRILVVDNNDDCLCMIKLIFEDCQAEIKTAISVQQAIQIIEEWKPHILISEIALPGQDGYSLIRFIRNKEANCGGFIPAIALTNYLDLEYVNTAINAGFQDVIYKPFALHELVETVANLAQTMSLNSLV
ncbi:MAG: response regulator [Nostoc sp. ChiSLP02]|nr:response regulator [Nostoc sp. DedSLP05]MDZ8098663.1 response regulator [Nostoc sp. DedSLP01]MDZ8183725.1 response regulator [Nostoc sp. ChiSLP02]